MSDQLELLSESPIQWRNIANLTPEIQKREIKPFVLLALKELEGNPDSRTSSLMNANKFAAVREVVRHVARCRSATIGPWSEECMKSFLENLRFGPDCTAELTMLLCSEQVYQNIPRHLRIKPGLVSFQWRIDLSLCQVDLSEPADVDEKRQLLRDNTKVITVFHLTDGQTFASRLSVEQFQRLRYCVASALKSVIVLEKRKCMRD